MEYCKDCANKNCEFVEVGFALKRRHLFFCAQKNISRRGEIYKTGISI